MNKIIEKILLIFLLFQPFLDAIATTNLNIINIIIRGLFLLFIIIYMFINKSNIKVLLFLLLIALTLFGINIYLDRGLINTISSLMKLYYLPITILFFINIKNSISDKYLLYTLFIYLILFLLSYIFGFGYNNYKITDGKSGFRGVFNSINEISAIIICLFPIGLNYLKEKRNIIVSIILIIFVFIVSLLTGTKVLTIGLLITLVFIYYKDLINIIKNMATIKKILSIILILVLITGGIYLLTYTRFYKNMVIQQNFFKVNNIISLEFINKIIFNDRLTFLKDNFIYYTNQDIINILFGIGYNNILKLIEIDIFDILFRFGIFGLTSFIIPIIFTIKKIKLNKIYIYSLILLVLISLTSGHVLLSPNVSIYFGYIILIANNKILKKNKSS